MTRNSERDSSKIVIIGKSAAKTLNNVVKRDMRKVQRPSKARRDTEVSRVA